MVFEFLGLISGTLGILGVLLNNRRLIWCFPVWLLSNALSCSLHLHAALWSLAGRDLVFLILSFDGWRRWRKR